MLMRSNWKLYAYFYISNRNEYFPQKTRIMCKNVHGKFLHDRPKLETFTTAINVGWNIYSQ